MARLRSADLVAGLARLADLGFGLPAGEALRSSALAVGLGRSLDLPNDTLRAAMCTALLRHVGCTGYAHETAQVFGDEHALNVATAKTDIADPRAVFSTFLPEFTKGRPPRERAKLAVLTFTRGSRFGEVSATAVCEIGRDAARRLGLPDVVQDSLYRSYELWNGGGVPDGLDGEDIPVGARIAQVCSVAVLFDSLGGTARAVEEVRRRAGGMLDPDIAEHLARHADPLLSEIAATDPHRLVLDGEPEPVASVLPPQLVEVAAVFGDPTGAPGRTDRPGGGGHRAGRRGVQ